MPSSGYSNGFAAGTLASLAQVRPTGLAVLGFDALQEVTQRRFVRGVARALSR